MKHFIAVAALFGFCLGVGRHAAPAQEAADFGTAPSGAVPLLFNDRHVYAKPDKVRAGRVIVALVRDKTILVPLRSLFEQMGATVDYDSESKTADITAKGVKASLTVGVAQITINGETRPLDVPAEISGGVVLVPIRVLVETLGGYVQYLSSVHAVAIRYNPVAAFVPTPSPQIATPAPLPTTPAVRATVGPGPPIPVGTPQPETFIIVNTLAEPQIANAIAPVVTGASGTSYSVEGRAEFTLVNVNFDIGAAYEAYSYAHPTGAYTQPDDGPKTFDDAFLAIDRDDEAHLGVQLAPQKYYVDLSYATQHITGYPRIGGLGLGFEKLPDLNRKFDFDFDTFYYPNLSGYCSSCPGGGTKIAFRRFVYAVGVVYSIKPLLLDAGYQGDLGHSKAATSDDYTHSAISAGLGVRL